METERISAEYMRWSVVEKGQDSSVRPGGLARKLRGKIPCLFAAAAVAVAIPASMVLTGYFFKMPQLIDWGFNVGMVEIGLVANAVIIISHLLKQRN